MTLREASLTGDKNQRLFYRFSNLPDVLLDSIANRSKEAIIIWNQDNEICYASKSIKNLFGYDSEDVLGTYWHDYLEESHIENVNNYLSENTNESGIFYLNFLQKDKTTLSVEFLLSKVYDESTKSKYCVCHTRMPLPEIELDDTIVQSEKMSMVGQLTASVAHEIRNPLTSIKGFLQLLQAGVDHKDEYYTIMLDEIEKMETITSELLDIVKPVTNTMENESVYEIIRDVVTLLHTQAKLKNVSIKIEEPITETLYCNRSQLKQVLINLIKNAIEAMEEPGEITLYVGTSLTHLTIHVRDEGTGIPVEAANRIEDPFFTTKKNGTGLGLLITKQIVDNHGGSMSFSKNKDKGTTFCLKFPKMIN